MTRCRNRRHSVLVAAMCLALSTPVLAADEAASELVVEPAQQVDLLIQRHDSDGLVKLARQLQGGDAVSVDNPLRVPDFPKARQAFEAAVTIPGPRQGEAKLFLAKMMLSGEGDRSMSTARCPCLRMSSRQATPKPHFFAGKGWHRVQTGSRRRVMTSILPFALATRRQHSSLPSFPARPLNRRPP